MKFHVVIAILSVLLVGVSTTSTAFAEIDIKDIAAVCSGLQTATASGGRVTISTAGGYTAEVADNKDLKITQSGRLISLIKDFTYEDYAKCLTTLVTALTAKGSSVLDFRNLYASSRSSGSFWTKRCNDMHLKYFEEDKLGLPPPPIPGCSDNDLKQYKTEGWVLNVEFTNAGPAAAETVKVALVIAGDPETKERSFERIAKDVRVSIKIESLAAKPTALAVCISYNNGGQSVWTLYQATPPDRSGPFDNAQLTAVSANTDGAAMEKVDDGIARNALIVCEGKAQQLLAGLKTSAG